MMNDFFDNMRERATSLLENANEELGRPQQEGRLRQELETVRRQLAEQLTTLGQATLDLYRQDALPVATLAAHCRQLLLLEETVAALEAALAARPATAGCPACGAPLEANAQFCTHCGQPLAATGGSKEEQAATGGTRRLELCPECGTPLVAGATFCDTCGRAIAGEAPPPDRGTRLLATCARCGTPLPPGAGACGECGHPSSPSTADDEPEQAEPAAVPANGKTTVAHAPARGTRQLDCCATCGAPLMAGAVACAECGEAVTPETVPAESGEERPPAAEAADHPPSPAEEKAVQFAPTTATPAVEDGATRLLTNCQECGALLDEGALFCSDCGHPAATGNVPPPEAGTKQEQTEDPAGTRLLANCQGCGALLMGNTGTCPECGRPVDSTGPAPTEQLPADESSSAAATPSAPSRRCAHCGQTVRTTSPFCPACGGPLDKAPSPAAGARPAVRMHCGMVLEPHVGYCPQCGAAVPSIGAAPGSAAEKQAPGTVICPDCHTSFRAGTLFCPACGYFMNG